MVATLYVGSTQQHFTSVARSNTLGINNVCSNDNITILPFVRQAWRPISSSRGGWYSANVCSKKSSGVPNNNTTFKASQFQWSRHSSVANGAFASARCATRPRPTVSDNRNNKFIDLYQHVCQSKPLICFLRHPRVSLPLCLACSPPQTWA